MIDLLHIDCMEKECIACGDSKPVELFNQAKGLCKRCEKDKLNTKKRAYREANKDKINAQNKAYYEANKDKRNAQNKAYYEVNKDKINVQQRAYYEVNKENPEFLIKEIRRRGIMPDELNEVKVFHNLIKRKIREATI